MSESVRPREGYTTMLDALIFGLVAWFRLYTNDPELSLGVTRADFVEAIFPGYDAIRGPRWTPAALRGGKAISVVDPLIWLYTTGETGPPVRGMYVTSGADGPVLWAWRRPGDPWQPTEENPMLILYGRLAWPPPGGGP